MCLNEYSDIIKFFDQKSIHWHFSEKDIENATRVVDMLDCKNPEVILDVGCGTGGLYSVLYPKYPNVKILGMDISKEMLTKVSAEYDLLFQGNAEHLSLRDCSVDIVLNYCVFPHFLDKIQVISESYRVLKPGGHYYIIHPDGRKKTDEKHKIQKCTVIKHFLPENHEIHRTLAHCGFRVFKHIDDDVFLFGCEK